MKLVGIDTSSVTASAAVIDDGQLIAQRCYPGSAAGLAADAPGLRSNHAEILLPLIESVLAQARVALAEMTGLAVAIGPGSFTGLRIGLSTVKGLAYGWGIPVIGVSTLLAQAARVEDFDGLICALLDARKNEVYAALFRRRQDSLARLTDDFLAPVERVIDRARATGVPCLFIGDGVRRYEKRLIDGLGDMARRCAENSVCSCAAAVARLGMERLRRSESDDLGQLVPVYLRPSEAEAKRSERF